MQQVKQQSDSHVSQYAYRPDLESEIETAIQLETFHTSNGDEMIVIAADENVDLNQLQHLIESGNVTLATEDQEGETFEESQVIHLTAEQTVLYNSGVPIEHILSNITGMSRAFTVAEYEGGVYQVGFGGCMSTGIGMPGAGNPNGITYRCPSCPTMYVNANAFTKHMREKHFVRVYTCRNCPEFFDSLSNLFLHARRAHVDPKRPKKNPAHYKFHCEVCGYMTNNGGTMEHHKRAHTGEKPYSCDVCGKRFAQKANMKTHRNRHTHTERVFKCDTCNKGFASHDIYLAHLRTREHELREHYALISSSSLQLECLGCRVVFDNVYSLNKHYRCCRVVRTLQMKFRCILCDVLLHDLLTLKSHVKQHEGVTSIGCPVCGERGFPGFNQLNHHITRAHALKVNRRHVCRYCESTYESKRDLDSHVKQMHADERNARQSRGAVGRLKCSYDNCDFTTNSIMLLDRHHGQHQQLEEDGLNANHSNLPPARNETRGMRKTMVPRLLENAIPRWGILSRGRRGNCDVDSDMRVFENEVVAMISEKGCHNDDDDNQSDWEAEFQASMAKERVLRRAGLQVNEFMLPELGHDFNMDLLTHGSMASVSHRRDECYGESSSSTAPYWSSESGRSGRVRKIPAWFQDYETELFLKDENSEQVEEDDDNRNESEPTCQPVWDLTNSHHQPAFKSVEHLLSLGYTLFLPNIVLDGCLRRDAEALLLP